MICKGLKLGHFPLTLDRFAPAALAFRCFKVLSASCRPARAPGGLTAPHANSPVCRSPRPLCSGAGASEPQTFLGFALTHHSPGPLQRPHCLHTLRSQRPALRTAGTCQPLSPVLSCQLCFLVLCYGRILEKGANNHMCSLRDFQKSQSLFANVS